MLIKTRKVKGQCCGATAHVTLRDFRHLCTHITIEDGFIMSVSVFPKSKSSRTQKVKNFNNHTVIERSFYSIFTNVVL